MNRRASCVGTFEVFEAAQVALRTLLAFSQPVNCIFWPIGMLNWLVAASKLHKHRETCCTAEWPFYSFLIVWYYVNSLKDEPIDVKWDEFETTVKHIMNTCIPNKLTSSSYNLPWLNRPLRRLSRAKQRAYNKAKKSGKDSDWSKYRNMKKSMRNQLKSTRDTYISDYLGDAIKENPTRFWSFIKQLNQDDPGVADLEVNNEIIHEAQRKSEILNNYFSSVYTDENINEIPDVGENPTPGINPLIITVHGVLKQLDSLKPNKAGGPDEIPAWFLKEYTIEIAPVLTNIFRSSIESGTVPNKWKKAKKGKKSDLSNYRPISLTCISSKLLEHIIHSHMMKHFENYRVLNYSQHGFRAKP